MVGLFHIFFRAIFVSGQSFKVGLLNNGMAHFTQCQTKKINVTLIYYFDREIGLLEAKHNALGCLHELPPILFYINLIKRALHVFLNHNLACS